MIPEEVTILPAERERLFNCEHFRLWRISGEMPFTVGFMDLPQVLVCLEGNGNLEHAGILYAIRKGMYCYCLL